MRFGSPDGFQADIFAARDLLFDEIAAIPYPPGYAISKRWQRIFAQAIRDAREANDAIDIARQSLRMFDLPPRPMMPVYRQEVFERWQATTRNYPELVTITESLLLPADNLARFGSVRFSAKMEQAFTYYANIKAGAGDVSGLKAILEIGAGYGRFARLMHLLDPSRRYFLIDLPEALIFPYAFLRFNFPDENIALISSLAAAATVDQTCRFVLCPVQFLSALKTGPVDLVINTHSFAEMTQGCVDYFMREIDGRIRPRFIYSLNMMFTDKALHFDTGGHDCEGNNAVLNLAPQWWPRSFDLHPSLGNDVYRLTVGTVLERVDRADLIGDLQAAAARARGNERIGYLYFAALWAPTADRLQVFADALADFYASIGYSHRKEFNLGNIGEIKLLSVASQADKSSMSASRPVCS